MKRFKLTKTEKQWLRWMFWEPLRRNEHYRTEVLQLKDPTDFESIDHFCERWRVPWPISPTIEFDELAKAPWLADFFSAYFIPHPMIAMRILTRGMKNAPRLFSLFYKGTENK